MQLHLRPFKLPRGEAADMEVMPFRFEPSDGGRKLDLKLQFVLSDGPIAYRAGIAEAGAAPRAVRFLGRQFPAEDCSSSLLAKPGFIWHSVDLNRGGSLSRAEHGRHQALRGPRRHVPSTLRRALEAGADMKIHALTRLSGGRKVPAWPPRWIALSQAGDASDDALKPGEGVLESVMRHDDDRALLRLTMRFGAREHTAILLWDGPPPVSAVESFLRANVGREIRAIGELDCWLA